MCTRAAEGPQGPGLFFIIPFIDRMVSYGNVRKNGATAELPVASAGRILAENRQPVEARS